MRLRLNFVATCIILAFMVLPRTALGQEPAQITIWLIPLELAALESPERQEQLNKCFDDVRTAGRITILNLDPKRDKTDYDQLIARGPDLAYPNLPLIKGQCETLKALDRFASDRAKAGQSVRVNVRFVWWAQAFRDLQKMADPARDEASNHDQISPDVAQVGSTWSQYLANKNSLVSQGGTADNLEWRELPSESANSSAPYIALRYTYDIRLIFYWKRPPDTRSLDAPISADNQGPAANNWMDSSTWKSIIESLQRHISEPDSHHRPPMAMPIGLTPNLLYDYLPLVTNGGGQFLVGGNSVFGNKVSLKDSKSLSIPEYLAQSATWKTGNRDYRILAFPEMTHEEAAQHFMDGDYVAIIEPLIFLKRWHKRLLQNGLPNSPALSPDKTPNPASARFWDYAGVTAPPSTFIGGSDLVVVRRTREKELASALARFMATDDEYTKTLAELGHLPAQRKDIEYGAPILANSLGDKTELVQAIKGVALDKDHEYPPRAVAWPIELESTETLEGMQRIWRRMGERNPTELQKTAAETEKSINERINWWEGFKGGVERQWLIVVAGLLLALVTIVVVGRRQFLLVRDRARALDQIRKVRGFASAALLIVDAVHSIFHNPYLSWGATDLDARKGLIIVAGLQGWRRGNDERNWGNNEKLNEIIWRAIFLALESVCWPNLFKEWESIREQCEAKDFLQQEELIRSEAGYESGQPQFYFEVQCPKDAIAPMPFMLEQALICLIQNSINASKTTVEMEVEVRGRTERKRTVYYRPVRITYDEPSDKLYVANEGPPLSWRLRTVINRSRTIDEFERHVERLMRGPSRHRPGIGLVEAYCIATHCYGGLTVNPDEPELSIALAAARTGKV